MINLLPQYCQKKIKDEELIKIISILGIVTIAVLLSFSLLLLLVKFFYLSQTASLDVMVAEKEQDMRIFDIKSVEKEVAASGKLVSKISDFYENQTMITELFSRISKFLPPGVILDNFSYASGHIDIKGFAKDRDALVAFKSNLESATDFKNVVFPSNSWFKAQDIGFTATLEFAGKKQ